MARRSLTKTQRERHFARWLQFYTNPASIVDARSRHWGFKSPASLLAFLTEKGVPSPTTTSVARHLHRRRIGDMTQLLWSGDDGYTGRIVDERNGWRHVALLPYWSPGLAPEEDALKIRK